MVTCLKNNNTTTDERARGNSLLAAAMSFGYVFGPGLGGFLAGFGTRAPLYADESQHEVICHNDAAFCILWFSNRRHLWR